MTCVSDWEALARRCETEAASRELDMAIRAAIYPDTRMRKTSIWLPRYTSDLTAAHSLSNWLLLHASDIGADGMPMVVLGNPGPTPPLEAKGIGGRTLDLTWCAAALRARAMEVR